MELRLRRHPVQRTPDYITLQIYVAPGPAGQGQWAGTFVVTLAEERELWDQIERGELTIRRAKE